MSTTIRIKNSSVAAKVPDAGDLVVAELAINLADRKLYSKDTGGNVFEIGGGASVPGGDTPPGSGNQIGDLFFDTTANQLLYWDGSAWVPISGDEVQNLTDLLDVTILNPADGDSLVWNGTNWVNADPGYLTEEEVNNILNGNLPDGTPNPGAESYLKAGDDITLLNNNAVFITESDLADAIASGAVYVGELAPPDPSEGDLWYNPNSPNSLYLYFIELTDGVVQTVSVRSGGSGYPVGGATGVTTTGGGGHELTVDLVVNPDGSIASATVNNGGHGYEVDDIVFLGTSGHGNGSLKVETATAVGAGTWVEIGGGGESYWTESGGKLYPTTTTNNVGIGGTLPGSPNISLNADGSASFAGGTITAKDYKTGGNVNAGFVLQDPTVSGSFAQLGSYEGRGYLTLSRNASVVKSQYALQIGVDGNSDEAVRIDFDGNATFAGKVAAQSFDLESLSDLGTAP